MWASRPTAARVGGAIPVGPKHQFIRRGGIYPARRRSRSIRPPGTMRASSPTEVYYSARTAVSQQAARPPLVVGADSISARGVRGGAGCGGMWASRPTAARVDGAIPVGRAFAVVCRGGPWPSRKPCGGARFAGRCKHRPLQRFIIAQGQRFPGRPGRWVQRRCSCMRSQVFSTSMSRMMSMGNLMMFLTRRRLLSTTKDWP